MSCDVRARRPAAGFCAASDEHILANQTDPRQVMTELLPTAPMTAVAVWPVLSRADGEAFWALPYGIYGDDPKWVAPLRRQERQRWSARHNASLRSRKVARFLAWRDGSPVGRIAAIVDPAFRGRWCKDAGFFGFFECADDPQAARALFQSAEQTLREQGIRRILGPINLTTHDEVGFLVDGFGARPMPLSPYNPPRYPEFALCAGYEPVRAYHAYLWTPEMTPPPVAKRLAKRLTARDGGLRIRPVDPRRWDEEARTLRSLYNAAFSDVWGFVPISWDEFRDRASAFKAFYRPELALIAECDGRPAGFALALPNVNEALAPLDGRLFPFGWIRLLRGLRRIRSGRLILLGVRPEYVGRGLSAILLHELTPAVQRLGMRLEVSLVDQENAEIQRVVRAFGAPCLKTYRLYGKIL